MTGTDILILVGIVVVAGFAIYAARKSTESTGRKGGGGGKRPGEQE